MSWAHSICRRSPSLYPPPTIPRTHAPTLSFLPDLARNPSKQVLQFKQKFDCAMGCVWGQEHSGWQFHDAGLSPKGEEQCAKLKQKLETMPHPLDCELVATHFHPKHSGCGVQA